MITGRGSESSASRTRGRTTPRATHLQDVRGAEGAAHLKTAAARNERPEADRLALLRDVARPNEVSGDERVVPRELDQAVPARARAGEGRGLMIKRNPGEFICDDIGARDSPAGLVEVPLSDGYHASHVIHRTYVVVVLRGATRRDRVAEAVVVVGVLVLVTDS